MQCCACRRALPLLAAALLLLLSSCSARVAPEAIPYQFRQSMIDPDPPEDEVAVTPRRREVRQRRRAGRPPRLRRCRRLEGRRYRGRHRHAVSSLLRACLGRKITLTALQGADAAVRRADPRRGDLVLFHNTRDDNGNRKLDDRFSDAGVVVEVRGVRVTFVYVRRGRVRLGVLNIKTPSRRRLARRGRIENTFLRIKRPADPPGTRYLAGQLLAGFAGGESSDS